MLGNEIHERADFRTKSMNLLSREKALQVSDVLERLTGLAMDVCNLIESHERLMDTSTLEHAFQDVNRQSKQSARTAALIRHLQNSCDNRCLPDLTGPLKNWGDYPLKASTEIIQQVAKHGYDYYQSGEFNKARLIRAFIGRLSKTEAYYHLGCLLLIEAEAWEKAAKLLQTATQHYPDSFLLALQHIKLLRRRHEWDNIIRFSEKFRRAHGTHYGLALQEGSALLAIGRHEEALSLLHPFLEKHAPVPPDQRLHLRTLYGLCLRRLGSGQAAERQFEVAFGSGLESAGIHLANLRLEMNQPDAALALFRKLKDGSFSLYAQMGMYRALRRLGQEVKATDLLKAIFFDQPSILKALVDYAQLDPMPQADVEEICMKIGSTTFILDDLGDSIFIQNNVFWRLWPPSREQR